jgi:AcrR family transcriptional regulator
VFPATIYIYYSSREDLLNQLYLTVFDETNQAAIQSFSSDMSLEHGLKTLWLNRYRYAMRHPLEALFLDQFINSPLIASVQSKESTVRKKKMQTFYEHLVASEQMERIPVKVYWAVALFECKQNKRKEKHKGH